MTTTRYVHLVLLTIFLFAAACETGLEPPPPEPEPTGAIQGTITYSGNWPQNFFRETGYSTDPTDCKRSN